MTEEEKAAKLKAVCVRLGMPVPQTVAPDWKALVLAQDAERERATKKPRKRGRPAKLTAIECLLFSSLVLQIMQDKKLDMKSERKATEYVWKNVLRGNTRGYEAFRKNIRAFLKKPAQELGNNEELRVELLRGLARIVTMARLAMESHPKRKAEIQAALKHLLTQVKIVPGMDFLGG